MNDVIRRASWQVLKRRIHELRKYLTLLSILTWVSHYLYRVRKIRLHRCLVSATSAQHKRMNSIIASCPTLHSTYWPTWYAPTAMLQFAVLGWKEFRARFLAKSPYKREIMILQDGARIALDWMMPSPQPNFDPDELLKHHEKPLCILLHGAFQDSSSATMIDLSRSLVAKGLPVVVVNRRGYGGLSLSGSSTARKLALYGFDEDLDAVLEEIYRRSPECSVAIVGFSCGAGFAARYVSKRTALSAWSRPGASSASRKFPSVVCAALLDSAHDVLSCVGRVRPPMNWVMNWGLKYWYGFLHRKALQEVSDDFSKAVRRIRNPFVSLPETYSWLQHLSGAKNERAWYDSQQARICDINVPSLFINSRDDPMARWENVEQHRESLMSNPDLVLAELNCGAHNCKYNFSGSVSIADAMISEFILSSWCELRCRQDASCQEGKFSDAVIGA